MTCFFCIFLDVGYDSRRIVDHVGWQHCLRSVDKKKRGEAGRSVGGVRILHKTAGNSSTQASAARCKRVSSLGLIPCRIMSLVRSICLLDCGCATDATSSRIFDRLQYFDSSPTAKFVPLSVIIIMCGMPNRVVISTMNLVAVAPSSFLMGFASTHFVNLSTTTSR